MIRIIIGECQRSQFCQISWKKNICNNLCKFLRENDLLYDCGMDLTWYAHVIKEKRKAIAHLVLDQQEFRGTYQVS